jgi:hypothetical protein
MDKRTMKLNRRKTLTQIMEDAWNWLALGGSILVIILAVTEVI